VAALEGKDSVVPHSSVGISVFNVEWFRDGPENLTNQTEAHWEIVDGGSTDGAAELALRLAEGDRRIRAVRDSHGADRRRCTSRNLGLEAVRGEIMAFLGADNTPVRSASHDRGECSSRMPEMGIVHGRAAILGTARMELLMGRGAHRIPVAMFRRFNVLIASATAVRRQTLGGAGFPENMELSQDWACRLGSSSPAPMRSLRWG